MLLRSSSTPILNSWIPNSIGSSPESDNLPQLTRTRSVTLMTSFNIEDSLGRSSSAAVTRSLRDSDLNDPEALKKVKGKIKRSETPKRVKFKEKEKKKKDDEMKRLLSSSGLGENGVVGDDEGCLAMAEKDERVLQTLVAGGGGGKRCGGFNGGDGSGFGSNSYGSNNWYGPDGTDTYYRKMIDANPGNALLLSNYAKFLKEIKGDLGKAEEYCGRAILANPTDGAALSLYADLIWQSQKDASRAQTYFDQAVKTDPNDCYVLASYARFLWDAEEEEEEEEENESSQYGIVKSSSSSMFFGGDSQSPPPLTAAS